MLAAKIVLLRASAVSPTTALILLSWIGADVIPPVTGSAVEEARARADYCAGKPHSLHNWCRHSTLQALNLPEESLVCREMRAGETSMRHPAGLAAAVNIVDASMTVLSALTSALTALRACLSVTPKCDCLLSLEAYSLEQKRRLCQCLRENIEKQLHLQLQRQDIPTHGEQRFVLNAVATAFSAVWVDFLLMTFGTVWCSHASY
ncbi:hypothetical protein JZ751_012028 [Albula glossodonta]|uniref:Uncharacterized protein n=1 Tax=Albula glossodonta TaxID=121402 RepID=A0A8T2PRD2_9TELE|nr:hypothetical protein JZ751_012028 [Albula glossodonta]